MIQPETGSKIQRFSSGDQAGNEVTCFDRGLHGDYGSGGMVILLVIGDGVDMYIRIYIYTYTYTPTHPQIYVYNTIMYICYITKLICIIIYTYMIFQ